MACYLRASGTTFNVDAFLQSSPLEWDDVWHVGEAKSRQRAEFFETSGLQIMVADGDDFRSLVGEAVAFLKAHSAEIVRLTGTSGVETATFDFGLTWDPNDAARYAHFSAEIVKLAAAAGCSLEVSFYDFR